MERTIVSVNLMNAITIPGMVFIVFLGVGVAYQLAMKAGLIPGSDQ